MAAGKIVFLDVDGTITTYENVIPDSARTAIRRARSLGHKVLMCTGRSKAENPPELTGIGFDGMIGGNGAYVEVEGRVVMHRSLTAGQCRRVVDWCRGRGLAFYLECNSGLYASEGFRDAARPALRAYAGGKGVEGADGLEVDDVMHGMVYGGELYRGDVNKVSFVLSRYSDYLDAVGEFPDMRVGTWGGAGETALFGDVGVAGIDKALAVRRAVEALGGDMGDTVAVGDAKVDIPMLEACAVGVAMGSGGEEIRAMADLVTGPVDGDGLYEAFERLGLLGGGSRWPIRRLKSPADNG